MTTVQELKELRIDYPAEAEIKGYKAFYNRVGNILRKTKLDEFANLFNIVCGEMSFIGERDIIVTTKKNIVFSRVVAANSASL